MSQLPKRESLQPLQIYQILPRTNCKLCGCASCFAFAFSLLSKEKKPEDCPDLQTEAFASSFRKLKEMLGEAEVIEGTRLALDKGRCNGCGDCVIACYKTIKILVYGIDRIVHRAEVPPVLRVIDGIIQVQNWDSCKRMADEPIPCRVCEEKCPFGALEVVK